LPAFFSLSDMKCYNKDQELNDWLQAARDSVDPKERQELYSKAQKRIVQEAYWMPFFAVHSIMGKHKDLNIIVGRDEVPRFNGAYWK
jgi:peptide/nickel transport system substrate-binding protein